MVCGCLWCLKLFSYLIGKLRSRDRFHEILSTQGIPLQLVLNYDQSWVNAFRTPKQTLRLKRKYRPSKEQVRVMNITGGRYGLTLCTSSWANGDHGPLFISLAPRSCSAAFVSEMNRTSIYDSVQVFSFLCTVIVYRTRW